jgi:ribosomal protein L27
MFTFDDSDPTTYTKAYKDVMEVMGYRGTKYVTSANVGIGGMITAAQCLEMQADGWCIGDHGHSHHNLNDLSYFPDAQAIIDEITTSFDELDALGLGQDKTIFAYPVSPPLYTWIEEAVETAGVVSAMGAANVYYQPDPALAHANIGRGPLSGMENLTFAKAIVDEAVAHNCLAVFAFHRIVDLSISNPPPANEWLKSDLQRLCDYIAAYGTISVITHKDLV